MFTENTLRNRAHKIGYHVKKGFQHFGNQVFYNSYGERSTGYMVMDLSNGYYIWDGYNENFDFRWSLEDVEDFLKEQYEMLGLEW